LRLQTDGQPYSSIPLTPTPQPLYGGIKKKMPPSRIKYWKIWPENQIINFLWPYPYHSHAKQSRALNHQHDIIKGIIIPVGVGTGIF
jgi:hypothetical protein